MADDDDSKENQNPPVAKEKEFWGVPMSTLYGIGIVAAGTLSLITALKVLLPPNFQLFPSTQQVQQNQPQQGLPLFGINPFQQQQQQQYQYPNQNQGNGIGSNNASNNNPVPRQDNSIEEYEVYDESAYGRGQGPKNIDIGVGQQYQQQSVYEEEEEDGNAKQAQIQTDNTQFRTTESVMRNNSGIQITESPDVVNSKRRFMKGQYQGSEYTDMSNLDYE
jgi:hypothetical protein